MTTSGKPGDKGGQPPPDPKPGRNPGYPEPQPHSREEAQTPAPRKPGKPVKGA